MPREFTYHETTNIVYNAERDENETFGYDFTHEVNNEEIKSALEDIIYDRYFSKFNTELSANFIDKVSSGIRAMLKDCDDIDKIADFFEDELKDYFEEEAHQRERGY